MAVFRIEKTRDYTVMSNHHLRDTGLSLKSKGLLSMMLSLPEDWSLPRCKRPEPTSRRRKQSVLPPTERGKTASTRHCMVAEKRIHIGDRLRYITILVPETFLKRQSEPMPISKSNLFFLV